MSEFGNIIKKLINDVDTLEDKNIKEAAKIIYNCMKNEGILHVFATGHSHMFSEELFYRAGGLVQIDPILIPPLMQHEGAITSTKLERVSGMASKIYQELDLKKGEPFIIVSNSGINSVPVEMANICKENGHPVIVITSMDMTKKVQPRNNLGLHLYELGDVVIDNHAPLGDGVIKFSYGQSGSCSSILGNFIAQRLVLEVIDLYNKDGVIPPIYLSANLPGGDEHNALLYEKYQKRIKSLK